MTDLIKRNQFHQEAVHNETQADWRAGHEKRSASLQDKIMAMAMCHGCYKVMWPGLYPVFVVDGNQVHKFIDVLSMEFGERSFARLVEAETKLEIKKAKSK